MCGRVSMGDGAGLLQPPPPSLLMIIWQAEEISSETAVRRGRKSLTKVTTTTMESTEPKKIKYICCIQSPIPEEGVFFPESLTSSLTINSYLLIFLFWNWGGINYGFGWGCDGVTFLTTPSPIHPKPKVSYLKIPSAPHMEYISRNQDSRCVKW
jgi:hypothetical protein